MMGYQCEISVRDRDARDAYVSACKSLGITTPDFHDDDDKVVWDGLGDYDTVFEALAEFANPDEEDVGDHRGLTLDTKVLRGVSVAYGSISSLPQVACVIEQIGVFGNDGDAVRDAWRDFLDGVTERRTKGTSKSVPVSVSLPSGTLRLGIRKNDKDNGGVDDVHRRTLLSDDCTVTGVLGGGNAMLRIGYDETYDTETKVVQDVRAKRENRHAIHQSASHIRHDGLRRIILGAIYEDMPLALDVMASFGEIELACKVAGIDELVLTSGW